MAFVPSAFFQKDLYHPTSINARDLFATKAFIFRVSQVGRRMALRHIFQKIFSVEIVEVAMLKRAQRCFAPRLAVELWVWGLLLLSYQRSATLSKTKTKLRFFSTQFSESAGPSRNRCVFEKKSKNGRRISIVIPWSKWRRRGWKSTAVSGIWLMVLPRPWLWQCWPDSCTCAFFMESASLTTIRESKDPCWATTSSCSRTASIKCIGARPRSPPK